MFLCGWGTEMIKKYNGHHCYGCWNVALWFSNDEGLYRDVYGRISDVKRRHPEYSQSRVAAIVSRQVFRDFEGDKTPDGVRYNRKNVYNAVFGLAE